MNKKAYFFLLVLILFLSFTNIKNVWGFELFLNKVEANEVWLAMRSTSGGSTTFVMFIQELKHALDSRGRKRNNTRGTIFWEKFSLQLYPDGEVSLYKRVVDTSKARNNTWYLLRIINRTHGGGFNVKCQINKGRFQNVSMLDIPSR